MNVFRILVKNSRNYTILDQDGAVVETTYDAHRIPFCLSGDSVIYDYKNEVYTVVKRAKYPLLAGRLELASKTKYGMTARGYPMYLFLPFRKEFPPFIVGCSEKDTSKNRLALIEFESWTSDLPRGVIKQMLGTCGDKVAERTALLWTHSPWRIPKHLRTLTPEIESLYPGLRVPSPEQTFSIDPAGCRDVDDALSIKINDDRIELWITIADVADVIQRDTALDRTAKEIAQTTYEHGRAVCPMLPVAYSEGSCSLLEGQSRKGLTLVLTIYKQYIIKKQWMRTTIINKRQYTYENFIEEAPKDGLPLDLLEKVFHILGSKTRDVHEWVEVCMLTYNIEAAKLIQGQVNGGILRKHKGKNEITWNEYEQLCPGLGRLAEAAAQYCSPKDSDTEHRGLGHVAYCHASSPIRRYADLINQRAIHAILDGMAAPSTDWQEIAWLNQRQKDCKHYERDLAFLEILLSGDKPIVDAIVINKKKVEGLIDTLSYSLWIDAWKRVVSWKTTDILEKGEHIRLQYYANPSSRFWKDRLVFRKELNPTK
jgi:exoribonuclease R